MRARSRDRLVWTVVLLAAFACSDPDPVRIEPDRDARVDTARDTAPSDIRDRAPDPIEDPDVEDPDLDLAPGDVADDLGDLGDLMAEMDTGPPPSFKQLYEPDPDAAVGILEPMGLHLTGDRLFTTGFWEDTARVSFFDLGGTGTLPWCLNDELAMPTGVTEEPVSGDIVVADMIAGLAVITPPDTPGDCGCDPGVETACAVWWWVPEDLVALGGVTAAADGTLYVSAVADPEPIGGARIAGTRAIVEVDLNDGTPITETILSGDVLGDPVGLHVAGTVLYVADSNGAIRLFTRSGSTWSDAGDIETAPVGFPADVAADATHYFWATQSPFAHPDRAEGGAVFRVTLDGSTSDEIGAGTFVWPTGLTSDGSAWFVADRVAGIWGFF